MHTIKYFYLMFFGITLFLIVPECRASLSEGEESDLEKTQEFHSVRTAHDFRNQLNGIRGLSKLSTPETSKENLLANIIDIDVAFGAFEPLLEDMIEAAKVRNSPDQSVPFEYNIKPQKFMPQNIFKSIKRQFKHRLETKDLTCELSFHNVPSQLVGDSNRLAQIFTNLLSNSIKYTETGIIKVKVTFEESFLKVSVIDNGRGIAPEDLALLSKPFVQAATNTKADGGSGLGLVNVAELCHSMGGNFTLHSDGLGLGTTANFWLRMDTVIARLEIPAGDLIPLRIAIVDDGKLNIKVISQFIKMHNSNNQVFAFQDGIMLVAHLFENPETIFDAFVLDNHMEVLDGVETARMIKTVPKFFNLRQVPIYLSSADPEGSNGHFAGVLGKPVHFENFKLLLNNLSQLKG